MGRVLSGTTGRYLPCVWDDCGRLGDDRYKVVIAESPVKNLIYIFCGPRHRLFYLNAREHKQLPSGSKSVGGFVGGVDLSKP